MVSSGGRLFAIVDEGPIASLALPAKWMLVARDAFSGVVLWKKRIGPWEGVLRPFRSGPTELARRLVAVDQRVYVTLGYNKPVSALEAATGEAVGTYADTQGAVEIIADGGVLYVVVGTIDPGHYARSRRRGTASPPPRGKRLLAVDAASPAVMMAFRAEDGRDLSRCKLDAQPVFDGMAAACGRLYLSTVSGKVVCLGE